MTERRIDHLVMPFPDLGKAQSLFAALGFTVGSRNRHPWGTENHIIQFPGSFLELITVGEGARMTPHAPRRFSFGQHVSDWLQQAREPMSMLVLSSHDARRDAADFASKDIGDFEPFDFRREGKRPDGSTVEVAFTLSFAESAAMPRQGFFVCQQHFPENFWSEAAQQHANGVTRLARLMFRHASPEDMKPFLHAFSGATCKAIPDGIRVGLQDQHIDVLRSDVNAMSLDHRSSAAYATCDWIVFETTDLAALSAMAAKAGASCTTGELDGVTHLLVSHALLGSIMLAFHARER
jgi:hypothetical protein